MVNDDKLLRNRETLDEIYRSSAEMVYNLALRISADPFLAEEAVQEVFIKVFTHLDTFQRRADIKTWIYSITVNTTLNLLKSRSFRQKRVAALDENIEISHPHDDPESSMEQKGRDKLVRKALKSLEPKMRTYIVLRDIEGLSYEDMSKVLNENLNTVRTKIRRARIALLEVLRKEADFHEMQ